MARHNPWLSDNTNIADVAKTNAIVAARMRTVPGVLVNVKYPAVPENGPEQYLSDLTDPNEPKSVLKSVVVDGENHTNDWSITDFTLAELKQWIRGTTYDARNERPTEFNGKYPVLSFQEIIDIAKARSATTGRTISIYPETKNPYWNNAQAIANGCGAPGSHPFEDALLKILNANDLNSKDGCADLRTELRSGQPKVPGEMIYNSNDAYAFVDGRPYSWTVSGDPRYFSAMLTPAGLAEIKTYADGIGPWKPQIIPLKVTPWKDKNADGSVYTGSTADATTQAATSLVADAHKAGLFVHVYTFRNEKKYLAADYNGDPQAEYLRFFRAGVDGVFTDFANTAVAARDVFTKALTAP